MHLKKDDFYPVFMMTHELGDRGENYRAPDHPLGIALLIVATFPDARTRIQTLWRVERFNDKAYRIQDTTFPEVDLDVQSDKMAADVLHARINAFIASFETSLQETDTETFEVRYYLSIYYK